MPRSGVLNKTHDEILTFEEISRLVAIFTSLGIKKIRLTGGEPLVRKGILHLVNSIVKIDGVEEVTLTTNGTLLALYAESLRRSGIKRINISLDTLNRFTYKSLTGSDSIGRLFDGINAAKDAGLKPIKLNTVIMKGINDKEITDFVEFALLNDLTLRFIEFMNVTPLWKEEHYVSAEEIKDVCLRRFKMKKTNDISSSPAEYYEIENKRLLGFIKTDKKSCRSCNRLRLASTGELRICLYEDKGLSLKELLRIGSSDEEIKDIVSEKMGMKQYTDFTSYEPTKLYMSSIGG